MFTRISSALLPILALAACGPEKTDTAVLANVEAGARADAADDGMIDCAEGQGGFTRSCTIDRETGKDGLILTLRHPNGAFHRLLVTTDGRGVVAADGAEKAVVTITGPDSIEVTLGGSRYRLPATVKDAKPAK